jgi:hypothetical protein
MVLISNKVILFIINLYDAAKRQHSLRLSQEKRSSIFWNTLKQESRRLQVHYPISR